MAVILEWKDGSDEKLGSFKECVVELPGGEIIHWLRARIQEGTEEIEWEDDDRPNARIKEIRTVYYPVLDIKVFDRWVRVSGSLLAEDSSGDDSDDIAKDLEMYKIDQEEGEGGADKSEGLTPDEKRRTSDWGQRWISLRARRHPSKEESFDDAVTKIQSEVRGFITSLRKDAQATDDAWGGEIMSVTQVAELFGVARNTVLGWINSGTLRAFRLGHKWMIRRQDLAAAMTVSTGQPSKGTK